jgi:hypothetical protein
MQMYIYHSRTAFTPTALRLLAQGSSRERRTLGQAATKNVYPNGVTS